MNFREYIEKTRKEKHATILKDICIEVQNCAACFCENTREIHCNPVAAINPVRVSDNAFYLEPYDGPTNRKILDIAKKHGYEAGIVLNGDSALIKFYRR